MKDIKGLRPIDLSSSVSAAESPAPPLQTARPRFPEDYHDRRIEVSRLRS